MSARSWQATWALEPHPQADRVISLGLSSHRKSVSLLQHVARAVDLPSPIPAYNVHPNQLSAADAALLAVADPSLESRIILIGPNTLELLCALLHGGSADVSTSRVFDRPQVGTVDVAVVAHVVSSDCLEQAVAHARRVLAPLGTVAIHLAMGSAEALPQQAGRLLVLHGFEPVRIYDHAGRTLIQAELPLHERLACA